MGSLARRILEKLISEEKNKLGYDPDTDIEVKKVTPYKVKVMLYRKISSPKQMISVYKDAKRELEVTKEIKLSSQLFWRFCRSFSSIPEIFDGNEQDVFRVYTDGKKGFIVDPQGYKYARYIGRFNG